MRATVMHRSQLLSSRAIGGRSACALLLLGEGETRLELLAPPKFKLRFSPLVSLRRSPLGRARELSSFASAVRVFVDVKRASAKLRSLLTGDTNDCSVGLSPNPLSDDSLGSESLAVGTPSASPRSGYTADESADEVSGRQLGGAMSPPFGDDSGEGPGDPRELRELVAVSTAFAADEDAGVVCEGVASTEDRRTAESLS